MTMVSIIIPAYNRQDFIELCASSALSQNEREIEVIIVDDGSTDDTGAICDRIAGQDNRVTVIHQDNCGVSAARQSGINIAKGEWICFLDSDDTLPPHAIKNYSKCFHNQPDIIVSGYNRNLDPKSFVLGITDYSIAPGLPGKLYRTELIKQFMPVLSRELVMGEDMIANIVLGINATSIGAVKELQYNVNLDNGLSVMHTFRHEFKYENFFFQELGKLTAPACNTIPYFTALKKNICILQLNGYRNVVLDGNNINTGSDEWKQFILEIKSMKPHLDMGQRLFITMRNCQTLFRLIMSIYLKLRK